MTETILTYCVKNYACPKCGAKKGDPCRFPSYGKTLKPHKDRIKLVSREEKTKIMLEILRKEYNK